MSTVEPRRAEVIEAELVPLAGAMPRPLQHPPAVRTCVCGNVTARGHNGFRCREVLAIRARVEADVARVNRPGLLARLLRRGGAR